MFESIWNLVVNFWDVLSQMAPYLLLGFFVAGLLSVLISPTMVERHLGGRGIWPVVKAAMIGVPIPLCSCGVIPVSASLRRHGASKASTISFLISTPETGVDSIAVTYSLMGGVFTIFRIIAALFSGVVGGLAVALLGKREPPSEQSQPKCAGSCCSAALDTSKPVPSKLRRIFQYGFLDLPQDIGKSLLLGLTIAALIAVFIPEDFFRGSLLSGGIGAMLIMAAIGVPIYVCATASVPMAMAMLAAGVSPGAVLVFLMVGPATNAATISMVWKVMGSRTAVIYVGSVVCCALLAGLSLDWLWQSQSVFIPMGMHHHADQTQPWQWASAAILLAVMGYAIFRRPHPATTTPAEMLLDSKALQISGMTCSHCVASVQRALLETPGVQSAQVDLKTSTAIVLGKDLDVAQLRRAVESHGYCVSEITDV